LAFEGMDVDQAQGLARQLEQHAQALAQVSAVTATLAAELALYWRGPAATAFQHEWEGRHRPALSATAHALSDMHARLTANIRDQQLASAATTADGADSSAAGSGTSGSGAAGGGTWTVQRIVTDISEGKTPVDKLVDLMDASKHVPVAGHSWNQIKDAASHQGFWDHNRLHVMYALHDSSHVQQAREILGKWHVPGGLAVGGAILSGISLGQDLDKTHQDAATGDYGAVVGDTVDTAADALKAYPGPGSQVTWLAGGDIALLKADYDLAGQIDWKEGVPNPFSGSNFRDDYLPTFKSLPGQTLGIVAKAFS
jgi:hypothetical protein